MKLIALRCPRCNQALEPGEHDEVVQCPNCRAAVRLDPSGLSLQETTVAAAREAAQGYVPVWVFDGRVTLIVRKTQGGSSKERDAREMWDSARHFYVPAWSQPLAEANALALELMEDQPEFQPGAAAAEAAFLPVVISPEDARRLIGVVVTSVEAERSDFLQELDFKLDVTGQTLWLLPARQKGDSWEIVARTSK